MKKILLGKILPINIKLIQNREIMVPEYFPDLIFNNKNDKNKGMTVPENSPEPSIAANNK